MPEVVTRQIGAWILRQRTPESPGIHPLVLMLHGWTGDENAMWIFAKRLPQKAVIAAPRGIYSTPVGGYGWHEHQLGHWPSLNDLQPAAQAINELFIEQNFPSADIEHIHLVGFSQGAALSAGFCLLYPQRAASLAMLSGFMPEDIQEVVKTRPLSGMPAFLAHGSRDERVPVEKARQAVSNLEEAGADVVYCEDDVGHKLSVSCFSSLERFAAYAVS